MKAARNTSECLYDIQGNGIDNIAFKKKKKKEEDGCLVL